MEIGIIGLPESGKTTTFNALVKGKVETQATRSLEPNIGVAKVKDPRLLGLEALLKPKRTVYAEVKYVDIPIPWSRGGFSGQLLTYLSEVDALIHVVRAFEDERIPHIEGSVDPERDIAIMNLELAFSDLAIIERRLERIEDSLRKAKPSERQALLQEQTLLTKIKSGLEGEVPVREQGLREEEAKLIENYQFLTAKPLLVALNIGEEQLPQASSLEAKLHSCYPQFPIAAICSKLEMELAQLSEAEAEEFRLALGIKEPLADRIIRLSLEALGQISFFTTASSEVKAWTVRKNTLAPKAAGKIHSDMERGFIRAEVINYNELVKCGSLAEARKRGLVRLEGKSYPVQDGDVITFLFSV